MSYLRVMILIPNEKELALEDELKKVDLCCLHFMKVRGYGCNPNFYASDWSDEISKFELVIAEDQLINVKTAIKLSCQTGSENDGILTVMPITEKLSIKDL